MDIPGPSPEEIVEQPEEVEIIQDDFEKLRLAKAKLEGILKLSESVYSNNNWT